MEHQPKSTILAPQSETDALNQDLALPHALKLTNASDADPRLLMPSNVLGLQRTIGNQAVQRLISARSTNHRSIQRLNLEAQVPGDFEDLIITKKTQGKAEDGTLLDIDAGTHCSFFGIVDKSQNIVSISIDGPVYEINAADVEKVTGAYIEASAGTSRANKPSFAGEYPAEQRKQYGFAPIPSGSAGQFQIVADEGWPIIVTIQEEPTFKLRPNVVLPSGRYLWGKMKIVQNKVEQFFHYTNWFDNKYDIEDRFKPEGPIDDGQYWIYEDFNNAATDEAETEHETDYICARELTLDLLRTVMGRIVADGQDVFSATKAFLDILKASLPDYLYPEGLSKEQAATYSHHVITTELQNRAEEVFEKLVHYSGFLRDEKTHMNNAPSHGAKEWKISWKDGYLVATRIPNTRRGLFKPGDYLEMAKADNRL